jgi:hypothetical protein
MHTKFLSDNVKESNDKGDLFKILEWISEKWGGKVWIECIWLRRGANGCLL